MAQRIYLPELWKHHGLAHEMWTMVVQSVRPSHLRHSRHDFSPR
jgi:hypothetical protein